MTDVAIKLKSGTVVDRKKLNALDSNAMQTTLTDLYSEQGSRVVIVDNTAEFFGIKSLLAALNSNDANLDLMIEYAGETVTTEEMHIIKRFNELKQRIADSLVANTPLLP